MARRMVGGADCLLGPFCLPVYPKYHGPHVISPANSLASSLRPSSHMELGWRKKGKRGQPSMVTAGSRLAIADLTIQVSLERPVSKCDVAG